GYLSHMHSALATRGHVAFGWLIFACALLSFAWAAGGRGRAESGAPAAEARYAGAVAGASAHRGRTVWRYGMVVTALLAVPVLVYVSLAESEAHADTAVLELPPARTPWRGTAGFSDPLWQPTFVGAHAEQRASYQGADGQVVEVV